MLLEGEAHAGGERWWWWLEGRRDDTETWHVMQLLAWWMDGRSQLVRQLLGGWVAQPVAGLCRAWASAVRRTAISD